MEASAAAAVVLVLIVVKDKRVVVVVVVVVQGHPHENLQKFHIERGRVSHFHPAK